MRNAMTCTIISVGTTSDIACYSEHEPPYIVVKNRLRNKIWQLYCRGYDRFWLNCEYGVPLWCAEIIIALQMYNDIVLNIAMPYEEQPVEWTEEQRERFFSAHISADNVVMISNYYTSNCYDLADIHMIDDSDIVLIVGNSKTKLFGDKYAREKGVPAEYLML